MIPSLISSSDSISVDFTNDAWFNATKVAKNFGKLPNDWLRLDSTKEYIEKLEEILIRENPAFRKEENSLQKTTKGKYGGGTWLSPKLAVPFARWLDVGFSIWCDMQIEKILHPFQPSLKPLPLKKTKVAVEGGLTLETQDELK